MDEQAESDLELDARERLRHQRDYWRAQCEQAWHTIEVLDQKLAEYRHQAAEQKAASDV